MPLKKIAQGPIAEELAKKHKQASVAEFFERNRHLLGFDNKRKALLTVIKEAVDNALDACEEASILPEVHVEIVEMGSDRFRVKVEDNGPGIVRRQVANIFARLLYGSKFHSMKQARGQQGIGISAAVLYAQLTTGRSARIFARISGNKPAHYFEVKIDTVNNKPEIKVDEEREWKNKNHGVRIELDIEASYQKGDQSVDTYLKQTAIANPHATIIYTNPKAEQLIFARATDQLPKMPREIKPHPYGVELGIMMKMLKASESRTLSSFLQNEFSRVGSGTAKEICERASLPPNSKPRELQLPQIEKLMDGIKATKIISPPTDCLAPIGDVLLEKGLRKEVAAEFYAAASRSPSVYKGIPFVVEAAIAYGGNQPSDKTVRILRYANRVPLLYQQSACACFKSVVQINWRSYGLSQSQNSPPVGPLTVVVSVVSVWPPFTSEAKEAIAHYPEIVKEIKLALQECGRKLGSYVSKKRRVAVQQQRINIFENYIPEVANSLSRLTGMSKIAIMEAMRKQLRKNKEFIAQHKAEHVVEQKKKKSKEEQITLQGSFDE